MTALPDKAVEERGYWPGGLAILKTRESLLYGFEWASVLQGQGCQDCRIAGDGFDLGSPFARLKEYLSRRAGLRVKAHCRVITEAAMIESIFETLAAGRKLIAPGHGLWLPKASAKSAFDGFACRRDQSRAYSTLRDGDLLPGPA